MPLIAWATFWLTKLLLFLEVALVSSNWPVYLRRVYQSGYAGEIGLAVGFGLVVPLVLNGLYAGLNRGNWVGLIAGALGLGMLTKALLVLFAPHYLGLLPF